MWFIYDLVIHLYGDAIRVASLFNPKARKWVDGRRSAPSLSASWRKGATAWFHCASLGEFEQGRPVIEAFRKSHPDWRIILTFFSPSGYEIRKNYEGADQVFYLPLDTAGNAGKFIRTVQPSLVIFVKYEYWFHYLDELNKASIPVYIISAIFRKNHPFFKWYGGWMLKQLKKVTGFFVQDEESLELLKAKGIEQVIVSGDTRFDRVATIALNSKSFPLVEKFAVGKPVFLAGSTWPPDEELIIKLIEEAGDKMKFIIAPHEVGKARIDALLKAVSGRRSAVGGGAERSPDFVGIGGQRSAAERSDVPTLSGSLVAGQHAGIGIILFSELNENNASDADILVVDGIGYLSHLYQYATIAYIGGGFGAGIHNILEAAAFGKPVIFGPGYEKFREAADLIEMGGAFPISNYEELNARTAGLLENKDSLLKSSEICSAYVQKKKGATGIILSEISHALNSGH